MTRLQSLAPLNRADCPGTIRLETDANFTDDEELYRRCDHSPQSVNIKFPLSLNRKKYSLQKCLLCPNSNEFKKRPEPSFVMTVVVGRPRESEEWKNKEWEVVHVPTWNNYSHCEIRLVKESYRNLRNNDLRDFRTKLRRRLVEISKTSDDKIPVPVPEDCSACLSYPLCVSRLQPSSVQR